MHKLCRRGAWPPQAVALAALIALASWPPAALAARAPGSDRGDLRPPATVSRWPPWLVGWGGGSEWLEADGGCHKGRMRKNTLKAIREMPFIGLFEHLRNITKFEASGMTSARGNLWIVFDNLHSLGRIDEQFQFRDPENILIGHTGEDSQFEGLSYDEVTGHFYVVEEVAEPDDLDHLHPVVNELKVDEARGTYEVIERCPVHVVLSHENKGIEGLHYFRHPKDPSREFTMGLCEGNFCAGGSRGQERGNGRVVIAEFRKNESGCAWDVVKVADIPPTANFMDYSGIDFRGDRIAITSQEDSAMYIGHFDFEALEFTKPELERVYYFPRDNHCNMIFCNVEGVSWLDDIRLIVSSDKAKRRQPYRCTHHDQSIHIFALPE